MEITEGYYWATYGKYPAEIVYVDKKQKVMFFGLSDRCNINKFQFHERIEYKHFEHNNA